MTTKSILSTSQLPGGGELMAPRDRYHTVRFSPSSSPPVILTAESQATYWIQWGKEIFTLIIHSVRQHLICLGGAEREAAAMRPAGEKMQSSNGNEPLSLNSFRQSHSLLLCPHPLSAAPTSIFIQFHSGRLVIAFLGPFLPLSQSLNLPAH